VAGGRRPRAVVIPVSPSAAVIAVT
jgi:hypothetical protein